MCDKHIFRAWIGLLNTQFVQKNTVKCMEDCTATKIKTYIRMHVQYICTYIHTYVHTYVCTYVHMNIVV